MRSLLITLLWELQSPESVLKIPVGAGDYYAFDQTRDTLGDCVFPFASMPFMVRMPKGDDWSSSLIPQKHRVLEVTDNSIGIRKGETVCVL